MPIHFPFNFPYYHNNYQYSNFNSLNQFRQNVNPNVYNSLNTQPQNKYLSTNTKQNSEFTTNHKSITSTECKEIHLKNKKIEYNEDRKIEDEEKKQSVEPANCFFEILGLKLYFDDILIICILLFLYNEGVQDQELFLCLILLLLT